MGNSITVLQTPVPCTTPEGDAYVWYIKDSGMFENDELTVIMCNGGFVRHFNTSQIKIWRNDTFGIFKNDLPY